MATGTNFYTTAGTFDHTTGAGVTFVLARVWGGGGAGGATSGVAGINAGAGGAGGQFARTFVVPVTGNTTYTGAVVVAAASAGAGNQSYFSTTGAAPANTTQGALAKGGPAASTTTPGTGNTTGGIGDAVFKGGNGAANSSSTGGGGGGGAGTSGAGANAGAAPAAGGATSTGGGAGGAGGAALGNGAAGSAAGGGGGGAGGTSGTLGNGAIGRVDVIEGFQINVSESITVTESQSELLQFLVNKSENVTVSENQAFTLTFPVSTKEVIIPGETNYYTLIKGDNPVAYWPLDDTSGTIAQDAVDNNNLTIGSAVSKTQSNLIVGGNFSMRTVANGATTGSLINLSPNSNIKFSGFQAFSLEYWTIPTALAANQFGIIASNTAGTQFNFYLYILATSGSIVGGYQDSGGAFVQVNGGAVSTSFSNHLVVTWDGSANLIVYRNASVVASSNAATTGILNTMSRLGVGGPPNGGSGNLGGLIDEVAIYNYALTPTQITNHYNAGLVDSTDVTLVDNLTVNDSITVTESHKEQQIFLVNDTENITVSESVNELVTFYVNVSENVSATDTSLVTQIQLINVSDSVILSDSDAMTLVANLAPIPSENITVTDTPQLQQIQLVSVEEDITVTENLSFTVTFNVSVSETLGSNTPIPVSPTYVLLDNGKLALLVADITPYPLYQRL